MYRREGSTNLQLFQKRVDEEDSSGVCCQRMTARRGLQKMGFNTPWHDFRDCLPLSGPTKAIGQVNGKTHDANEWPNSSVHMVLVLASQDCRTFIVWHRGSLCARNVSVTIQRALFGLERMGIARGGSSALSTAYLFCRIVF